MKPGIEQLRAREIHLEGGGHEATRKIKGEYHDRLLRVLIVIPFQHQMSLLALGGQSIYHEINTRVDVPGTCDRAFFYDFLFDTDGKLREEYRDTPYLSFEGMQEMSEFDLIAYGMTNPGGIRDFVKFMHLAKLPLYKREREGKKLPLIVGGGPAFANPVPYGSLFDYSIVGKGEDPVIEMIRRLSSIDSITEKGRERVDSILEGVPGLYISGSTYKSAPKGNEKNDTLEREPPHRYTSRILAYDTGVVVVNSGCKFECAFCQLGAEKLKNRNYADILVSIEELLRNGVRILIINSPTFTQFPEHRDLLDAIYSLIAKYQLPDFQLYIGSVRIDEITPEYLEKLSRFENFNHTYLKYTNDSHSSFVAVAPDFGNDRLMKLMRKGLTKSDVLSGVKRCVAHGVKNFHLYFLVGIESETKEDRRDIARMAHEISELTGGEGELYLKINLYIPSAQTIGQRMKMYSVSDYKQFIEEIEEELSQLFSAEQRKKIHIITLDESRLILESVLMRGGENAQKVLEKIIEFESSGGTLDENTIQEICRGLGIRYEDFLSSIDSEKPLPWQGNSDDKLLRRTRYFTLKLQNS